MSYLLQSRVSPLGIHVFSSAKQILDKLSVILNQSRKIIGLPKHFVNKTDICIALGEGNLLFHAFVPAQGIVTG